jgi:hypothetical protein
MRYVASITSVACLALMSGVAPVLAGAGHTTANAIRLEENHPDSFRHFAPELSQMRERVSPVNTEFGLHVSEIEPGLFFVTDHIGNSSSGNSGARCDTEIRLPCASKVSVFFSVLQPAFAAPLRPYRQRPRNCSSSSSKTASIVARMFRRSRSSIGS